MKVYCKECCEEHRIDISDIEERFGVCDFCFANKRLGVYPVPDDHDCIECQIARDGRDAKTYSTYR